MTACSVVSAAEPMDGTAPYASTWIIVEHPGPWAADALSSPTLDRQVAEHLRGLVGEGVRVLLARHVDRPTRSIPTGRNVWLARTGTRHAELLHGEVEDLAALTAWTSHTVREGDVPGLSADFGHPLVLVCSNGRRDACCAVEGRALLSALLAHADVERERVWECSHIGGHRFAPVTLTLPHGVVHGRIPPDDAGDFWHRTHNRLVSLDHVRGTTCHGAAAQAADIAVRRAASIEPIADLEISSANDDVVFVTHRDGRQWQVRVALVDLDLARPESCGAALTAAKAWQATSIDLL